MEIEILYTIDFIIPHRTMVNMIYKYCEEQNISMVSTNKIGIYQFTGSYESNIWKVLTRFDLKVFETIKKENNKTFKNK
jgi:hypothetical protein